MSKFYTRTKKNLIATAGATFVGIMVAIPISLAAYSNINAGAATNQAKVSTAQVSNVPTDFAQFAYAYNQGYLAKAMTTTDSGGAVSCSETTTNGAEAKAAAVTSNPVQASQPMAKMSDGKASMSHKQLASVMNSYNTYKSSVHNSSTSVINNTNSNNTVGSNNKVENKIDIEDSKNIVLGISNDIEATNISNNDSFNKDSNNTTTNIVNDSYNKETNVAVNSGNTTTTTNTENVAVNETEVKDSYNTINNTANTEVTKVDDSFNNTTTNDTTKINDSFNNTVEVKADVEIEN